MGNRRMLDLNLSRPSVPTRQKTFVSKIRHMARKTSDGCIIQISVSLIGNLHHMFSEIKQMKVNVVSKIIFPKCL